MTLTDQHLDFIVHAMQNLPPWEIFTFEGGVPVPWCVVTGQEMAADLVIRDGDLALQVQAVSAKIMQWGVLVARAQRVLEVELRRERSWKAGVLRAAMADGQKLTEKQQEALYRDQPQYEVWKTQVERATEALRCTEAVLEGFRAKVQLLKSAVYRGVDGRPALSLP